MVSDKEKNILRSLADQWKRENELTLPGSAGPISEHKLLPSVL
jgi:hypothetical protein